MRTRCGRFKTSARRGFRDQERPVPVPRVREEQDVADDLLQLQPAHAPLHPEGGHEPRHEHHRARREPRRLEAGDGAGGRHGRRQAGTPLGGRARHGMLLRRDWRTLVRPLREQGGRLQREDPEPVHPTLGPAGVQHGGRHAPPVAELRRPDHHRGVQENRPPEGGHDVGPASQIPAASRAE